VTEEKYTEDELKALFDKAREGNLPENFDDWTTSNALGQTIAHVAAIHGKLPKDFYRWDIEDRNGVNVATAAHGASMLPPTFHSYYLLPDYVFQLKERKYYDLD